ncbi:hypothetical protein IHE55_18305 [Streptomyces pactum]|uniref:Integral membrane protein n=1 Tax=Streptomyces pactum TaxID=68249 RepID=A0ABS0NN57_9ACTN|nr:hypothetical protein [Streptomyces pactum]MBH5336621.1 hypothetical protein [Streptomyces pactum]
MDARDPELRRDLDVTLQTRKELGEAYEDELVDSFLEKVEQRFNDTADRQVRRHLAEQQMAAARGGARPSPLGGPQSAASEGFGVGERFGFVAVSLVLAIPLSAIAVVNEGLPGLLIAWGGIFGVNAVHALTGASWLRRGRRQDGEPGRRSED